MVPSLAASNPQPEHVVVNIHRQRNGLATNRCQSRRGQTRKQLHICFGRQRNRRQQKMYGDGSIALKYVFRCYGRPNFRCRCRRKTKFCCFYVSPLPVVLVLYVMAEELSVDISLGPGKGVTKTCNGRSGEGMYFLLSRIVGSQLPYERRKRKV